MVSVRLTCQTVFHFCLPTGDKCKHVSTRSLGCVLTGCVLTAMSMIGLTLLGWSSFEFDTNGQLTYLQLCITQNCMTQKAMILSSASDHVLASMP